jgi:hypothetical protein
VAALLPTVAPSSPRGGALTSSPCVRLMLWMTPSGWSTASGCVMAELPTRMPAASLTSSPERVGCGRSSGQTRGPVAESACGIVGGTGVGHHGSGALSVPDGLPRTRRPPVSPTHRRSRGGRGVTLPDVVQGVSPHPYAAHRTISRPSQYHDMQNNRTISVYLMGLAHMPPVSQTTFANAPCPPLLQLPAKSIS